MCPKCFSQTLKIKQQRGWERIMVRLTAKRKYHCRECGTVFRAPDRRKAPRSPEAAGLARQKSRVLQS